MRKLLFIAYTFPPIPYGGTYRALRLCRGFAEDGIECHVVTIKEYPDIPNDHRLLATVPDSVRIHRTPIIDPQRRYQAVKSKFSGRLWFRIANKFISLLLRPITFPDHMVLWVPFAVLKARRVIKQQQIDTVLVSSPPDSSQLIGWLLKVMCKIHWIADFRDPIYGNVAQVNMINPSGILARWEKKLLAKYERFIARRADILVANTETHAGQLKEKYACRNVHVIRNSFDPTDYVDAGLEKYPEFTIAHIGSIYGNRNPDLLFAAISRLAAEYAPRQLNLKVVFLGLGGQSLQASIDQYAIKDYVRVLDQVPHKEAIACMGRSHLLLLIKATGKWSRGQIPGKFFEYVGSQNPILCIGPQDSEVADLIRDNGLGYIVEDNPDELCDILKKAYQRFQTEGALTKLQEEQIAPFSSPLMAKKMSSLLR